MKHWQWGKSTRNSYLISSTLSISEVWYGITQHEYEQLEKVDEMWMQNIMECSSSVPKDLLYFELALLPIRFIIQTRRLLYFHHILQQKRDSLLHRFFMAQLTHPTARDWVSQVLEQLEDQPLNLEIEEIKVKNKISFLEMVKEAIRKRHFLTY